MKTKFNGILTFILTLLVQITFAQEKTISGTVSSESGPLPGVTVLIKGTNNGTETDFDGNYSIQANTGDVIQFSFIGMKTAERTVGNNAQINVSMEEDNILDEIVITGQGSGIEKKRLSTKVDVLSAKDIEKLPGNQIDQLLQSTTPSAQIRLSSGQPGTTALIRTRGPISASTSATPVVIVDGVRVDNLNSNPTLGIGSGGANVSALADIPAESIEKIEYIKGGAATTLYGADAANGVIQIITKKGKAGRANFFFESRLGIISATKDFLKYDRTAEALFKPGVAQEFKVGINGGSENVTYNFSGSLYTDDSFNDYNEQIKRSLSFGLNAKLSDKFKYTGSFSYVGFEANTDFNANTSFSRFSAFEGAGRGNLDTMTDAQWEAEKARAQEIGQLVDINRFIHRFTNSNKFSYDILDNLQVNATIGVDSRTSTNQSKNSNALLVALGAEAPGTTDRGTITRALRSSFTTTADLNFTHKFDLENFSFVTIFGGQFFRTSDRQTRLSGSGGVDGSSLVQNYPTKEIEDNILENANYGVYFLENIGIYDVAYLEVGGRIDQNTSAGPAAKTRFLPKVGVTYNISDHDFYKDSSISETVSNVRVRANYGEATLFPRAFAEDRTFTLNTFFGQPAFTFGNPGNPNLVSEKVATTEFGLDLGFFNNRLNLGATYYRGITTDALFDPNLAQSTGQLSQTTNIGEIKNTGWEFELSSTLVQTENHTLNFNASYNKNNNVVTSTGGAPGFIVGGFTVIGSRVDEGLSLGYLRGTAAIRQADGTYNFERNSFLGDTYAPHFGSFSLNYSYKKFNLFMSGDYQFGGKSVDLSFLLRHLRGHDNTGIPADIVGTTSPFNYVNYFVFDSDFVKIRNIGLSYSFGETLKIFKNVTAGFNVTNPFNWTAGNFDPETTGSGVGAQNGFATGGFAYGTESAPRIYMTSLKFQF
ncbi:TonB-dependent receptor [uncultured Tenacibaculum sp.]|uniref:TonB-dependent receptor domain-containing protein n=1 Tax=uncultured Tenacibaculum sp. TaxID=174713 RepID=UPI00260C0DD6|nr:TonB-dependent receptor [uncultured Tenacibaculum sp.]